MQHQKRLLIITNRYPCDPDDVASPFVFDFRQALEQIGVGVDVVAPFYETYSGNRSYVDEHVHLFEWSDGRKVVSQLPLYHPATILKIRRYFRNGYNAARRLLDNKKYHGILALWAVPSGYTASKLSRKYDLPYAVWVLGSDINSWIKLPFVGRIILNVIKNADALYADGHELAMKARSLTERTCQFIPSYHAVGIDKTTPAEPDKKFISVGRIERSKGVFDLLQAFRMFLENHREWKLHFVGTGRAEGRLNQLIRSYGLSDSVIVRGYLPREEINRLLIDSKAAIIPSHSDSLPLTFGEAMQAGVPVICSEVGDMPFLIEKYRVGYHFPAGDVSALAKKMAHMAVSENRFSENCASVLEELDIANSARAVSEWLETVSSSVERIEYADANR